MFAELEEEIQKAEGDRPTAATKVARFAGLAILSVIAFGGLVLVILAVE